MFSKLILGLAAILNTAQSMTLDSQIEVDTETHDTISLDNLNELESTLNTSPNKNVGIVGPPRFVCTANRKNLLSEKEATRIGTEVLPKYKDFQSCFGSKQNQKKRLQRKRSGRDRLREKKYNERFDWINVNKNLLYWKGYNDGQSAVRK